MFLHVEASPDMTLREAHEYVVMFEKALGKRLNTTRIETHIEPEDRLCAPENALPFDADLHYVRAAVDSILPEFPMVSNVHDLRLTHMGGTPLVSFHWHHRRRSVPCRRPRCRHGLELPPPHLRTQARPHPHPHRPVRPYRHA